MSEPNARFALIDDNPSEEEKYLAPALVGSKLTALQYPDDFRGDRLEDSWETIKSCDVVLMDWKLDEKGTFVSPLEPKGGFSLREVIEEQLSGDKSFFEEKAFVLYSNLLSNLSHDDLEVTHREHVIARDNDVDWVLDKREDERLPEQSDLKILLDLAKSVQACNLPFSGDERASVKRLRQLLFVEYEPMSWHSLAWDDAESCGLPVQSWLDGDTLVAQRWLLHVVLPYPGVLAELRDVAIMLRLDPVKLRAETSLWDRIKELIAPYKYKGILSEFVGERWWKAGLNSFLSGLVGDAGISMDRVIDGLAVKLNTSRDNLPIVGGRDYVLVVNDQFIRTDRAVATSGTVRIQPDDWPREIAPPRIEKTELQNSRRIRELVHPDDEYLIDD